MTITLIILGTVCFCVLNYLLWQYLKLKPDIDKIRQEQLHQSFIKEKNDRPNKMGNTPSAIRK